ncbi:hypothetical protein DFJ58DRAFT_762554 [Suillus subalutaceus]|uniref:uncharacterized protein n=1 Tax=Suillus subalutaceus TaxID=48586 RepID=UPI001B85D7C1|nr:uncharacterized protein DFJ58DRAFT_762554 [Suillus subalutaceus]KAG1871842.1 hypothetical protein DFJ58DRAFT_762554 [Suillus subalutaceus]
MVFCLGISSLSSVNALISSALLTVVEIVHDDLSLCNVGGYTTFEIGATLVLLGESYLDGTSITALTCSALVIFMTIHVQDFADANGHRIARTIRVYRICVLPLLSLALASIWSLAPLCSVFFVSIDFRVGLRCFLLRNKIRDQST